MKRIFLTIAILFAIVPNITMGATFNVTNLSDGGAGSLRQAISDANSTGGADIIDATTVTGTITMTALFPNFTDAVTINGPTTGTLTVSGNNSFRIFSVNPGIVVIINNLTMANAVAGSNGGGIYSQGNLTLNYCTVRNCTTTGWGGGVFNQSGILTTNFCAIRNNTTGPGGGPGGGLYNHSGTFNLNTTEISNCTTGTGGHGGAMWTYNNASTTIINCTFSGNRALPGIGFANGIGIGATTASLINFTVAANLGTGVYNIASTINGTNILVCGNLGPAGTPDFNGTLNSLTGYNLICNTGGTNFAGVTTGNITGVPAASVINTLLGFNGGYNNTHNLVMGSPALDGGTSINAPTIDQRDVIRCVPIDMGAYEESAGPPGGALVALPASDSGCSKMTAHWDTTAPTNTWLFDLATDPLFTNPVPTYFNRPVPFVDSLVLTGLTPGTTYYYRVQNPDIVCASPFSNTIITTLPTRLNVGPDPVDTMFNCLGYPVTITLPNNPFGATFLWFRDSLMTDQFHTGLTYTTVHQGDSTVWIAYILDACTSQIIPVHMKSLVESPVPDLQPTVIACKGQRAFLQAKINKSYEILWYQDNFNHTQSFHKGLTYHTTPLNSDTVFWIASVLQGCTSKSRSSFLVDVINPPNPPVFASILPICAGEKFTLHPLLDTLWDGTYHWYRDSLKEYPFYVGHEYRTSPLNSDTTIYVSTLHRGCLSPKVPITIRVNKTPLSPSVTKPDTICGMDRVELIASSSSPNADFVWFRDSLGMFPFHNGNTYKTSPLQGDSIIWVSTVVGSCSSITKTKVILKIIPLPPKPVVEKPSGCSGNFSTLLIKQPLNGITYVWWKQENGQPVGYGSSFQTEKLWANSEYWVSARKGRCESERVKINIPVRHLPPPIVTAPKSICEQSKIVLKAKCSSGSTHWYSDSTKAVLMVADSFRIEDLKQTTTFYVCANDGYCRSIFVPVTINIVQPPFQLGINAHSTIGLNQSFYITGTANIDAEISWDFGFGANPRFGAGLDSQLVAYQTLGENTITMTAKVGDCYTKTTHIIKVMNGLGNSPVIPANAGISIYPNPVHNTLTISRSTTEPIQVQLINSIGQTVFQQNQFTGSELDLSHYPKGLYILQLRVGNEKQNVKIVKE